MDNFSELLYQNSLFPLYTACDSKPECSGKKWVDGLHDVMSHLFHSVCRQDSHEVLTILTCFLYIIVDSNM